MTKRHTQTLAAAIHEVEQLRSTLAKTVEGMHCVANEEYAEMMYMEMHMSAEQEYNNSQLIGE